MNVEKPKVIDQDFQIKLIMVEWAKQLYWAFEWGDKAIRVKDETILWLCEEMVWWDAYCEFEQLSYEYQYDIVETLISIKKKDWSFMDYTQ